ncbi:hypothetical protein Zm00014a_023833 [Zea mays]|uniref:Uncharacterized protein n=1 Tax=Zea mays TaxID=4577 RepID=A0A3L6E5I2_MAIZE|nr:hypothetical protein Zm00014a_023833 [Zea mays]
MRLSFMRVAH